MSTVPPHWFPAPTMADLRAQVRSRSPAMSTGWPELDALLTGLRPGEVHGVLGAPRWRRPILSRLAAWAAGDGYAVTYVGRTRPATDMKLEAIALASGVSAHRLLAEEAHDPWLDRVLQQLHLRVLGVESDPATVLHDLLVTAAPLDLLVLDDYGVDQASWRRALDLRAQPLDEVGVDLARLARHRGVAVVVAGGEHMDWLLDESMAGQVSVRGSHPGGDGEPYLRVQLQHADGEAVVRLACDEAGEPVVPSADDHRLTGRPGRANVWRRHGQPDLQRFGAALGAERLT